jgi:hypothetical protein
VTCEPPPAAAAAAAAVAAASLTSIVKGLGTAEKGPLSVRLRWRDTCGKGWVGACQLWFAVLESRSDFQP